MENFIVSARKYRPSTFAMVVGQPNIVQTLKNAISNNSLAQAFLFTGPRGIGKTTCARILAKTINCLNIQEDSEPCNECESCRSFNQLASFNIQELDAASNSSVDDMRVLIDQVRIPPQAGKYKVYIIDEVHMLSANAFNAFLKTLEEPPPYAKFILATTERHKILPTILSRCQIYDFKRITVTDIAKHLAWVSGQEKITFEEEALHIIAQKADGALRDALSIFDQIVSFSGRNITYQDVIRNLNLLDYEYYFRVMNAIGQHDIPEALLILDEIIDKGFDGQHFINGLGEHLRSLLLCKDASIEKLLETSEGVRMRYQKQAQDFPILWLVSSLDLLSKADQQYRNSSNKRLHLELLLLQLVGIATDDAEKKKPEPRVAESLKPETPPPPSTPVLPLNIPAEKKEAAPPMVMPPPVKAGIKIPTPPPEPQGKRISIKEMLGDQPADKKKEDADETKRPDREIQPLDQEEIQKIITRYAEEIADQSPSFAAAITHEPIIIGEDNTIRISFSNKVAADHEYLKMLSQHIRSQITESWFRIEPIILDIVTHEKAILTPREKYLRMADQNPEIESFVKKLGLEFEG